uniref:non-specific serine/threonine protein kinase n=1 Tax=Ditylenchus dipsaci TaxID=166011 RepID=A0A915DQ03_9BILA
MPSSTPSTARTSISDPIASTNNTAAENGKYEKKPETALSDTDIGNNSAFIGEQGKRVRFYRNGDQFFKGLCVEGQAKFGLDELEHGHSYVCASTDKFKAIDYANASQPMWAFVSSKLMSVPPKRGIRATFEREPNDFVRPESLPSLGMVSNPDVTAIVKLNSGVVRKLYALSGKQVTGLADFFGDDHVFVAYGPEKMCVDDFYVISEEYKRMNVIGAGGRSRHKRGAGPAGKCEMPVRNDGFQKTLSPDPRQNINQAMKLPAILQNSIQIVDLLGDGNTALVFKALFRDPSTATTSSTPDALKIISKESAEEMLDFVKTEIQLLSEIQHEFIVQMREYHVIDNSWFIRMELMEDGDLFEYLRKKRVLHESDAASCLSCLSKALEYLHNRNIVHRDVKPENLLTYKYNELLYHLCGTPTYVAPEVLAEFGYSFKADCWSAGIILYILLCGFPPFGFDEDEVLFNKILRGEFEFPSPSFDEISFAARLLIRSLLSTEPEGRYSANKLLNTFGSRIPAIQMMSRKRTA